MADAADAARQKWEQDNKVQTVRPDEIYNFDENEYSKLMNAKPWAKEYDSNE